MNQEIYLRKATLADVHRFAVIKAEAYHDDRSKSIPPSDCIPDWYNGEWFVGLGVLDENEAQRIIENQESYLIMLEDTAIGGFWVHSEMEGSLSLEDFCILPRYQGNGYGTRALYLLEEQYPDNKIWSLGTPFFCKRNQHLYEKVGYKEVGLCSNNTVVLYEKRIDG